MTGAIMVMAVRRRDVTLMSALGGKRTLREQCWAKSSIARRRLTLDVMDKLKEPELPSLRR